MDRRRFLLGLAGAFAATTLMASGSKMAEALPLQPPPDLPPDPIPEPAVATEADLEAAKAQEAYWVVRRRYYYRPWRRRWRRRYWRRYYYRPYRWRRWRRRYWRRRYYW